MKRALIYIEQEYQNDALDLLETVKQIYADESCETYGLVINSDSIALMGKFNIILKVNDETVRNYDMKTLGNVVARLHEQYDFDSILIPATPMGRMLAPRIAMRLKTGLVADITEISHSDKDIKLVRPAYSGRIMAGITVQGNGPVMMTVRPGVFSCSEYQTVQTKIIEPEALDCQNRGIRRLMKTEKTIEYDIRDSEVLISGGGGVSKSFKSLETLAETLGAQVSASRAIIDKGLAPRTVQVGQSGKTVSPRLYIALGIYGAIQHIAGLNNVENIISVNTNRHAPICSLSDIVVEGDAVTFINKLVEKIKKEQNNGTH